MPRTRLIKPAFFLNDILGTLPPLARILFIGLWTIADREGKLEDSPKKIKVQILPYDECDVDNFLDQLHSNNFIIRYVINGCKYIKINNFLKHQHVHLKEMESVIPEPNLKPYKHRASTNLAPTQHQPKPGLSGAKTSSITSTSTSTSFSISTSNSMDSNFQKFWEAYNYKKSIEDAKKAFIKINPDEHLMDKILNAIELQKQEREIKINNHQNVPDRRYPATWLNGRNWEDEVDLTIKPNEVNNATIDRTKTTGGRLSEDLAKAYADAKAAGFIP